ncbi:MAG: nicotinate phosphoribosyltransferase, partial [Verrucomicrobiaceae bacterium]
MFGLLARETVKQARKKAKEDARSRFNIILNGDSYKASHFLQYPENTKQVYSYIESRGGAYDEAVFFGLQMFVKEYLTVRVTMAMVEEAAEVYAKHGVPFNRAGWEYIVREKKGKLPIAIRAVKEGTVVPVKNILVSIVNTDVRCFWLTSFLETALLRAIWFPVTVATRSYEAKRVIKKYLDLTSDIPDILLPSRLHDFGARGTSSEESAGIGGLAHLVNFEGTDTMSALRVARNFYGVEMPGQSIPAAEHSTITSWVSGGKGEVDAYRNMLRQFARPGSFVAVVSDSYDLWNAIDNIWGVELKDHVVNSGATVIIRPDSGDVLTVPVEAVKRLADRFGFTVNGKGFKVLNNVRVIQGDGIDDETVIEAILKNLTEAGFATDNIAFGMGGGLLQKLNRD